MFGTYFYHQTTRKMVVAFGTLFNDIEVRRTDAGGNVIELIKVPLAYGPKQKFLTRISADPNLNPQVALTVPRMGFELTSLNYDAQRKLNTIGKTSRTGTTGLKTQYNPVPYNFEFSLFIYVKNAEDGTQILEQILPFFTPDFTVTMNLIPSMGVVKDIPIVLNSVTSEDSYEGDFATRRSIIWTLTFQMKGYFYPNIRDNQKIITKTIVDTHLVGSGSAQEPEYLVSEDSTAYNVNYLTLDGDPTDSSTRMRFITENSETGASDSKVVSRVETEVENPLAFADDDFGFTQTITHYEAGITSDPVTGTDTQ